MVNLKRPKLIGLCSPSMGSGKTTIAHYLEEAGYCGVSMAAPLKAMFRSLLITAGITHGDASDLMADRTLKEAPLALLNGKSPRFAMQTLGTDWGRALFGDDLWINIGIAKAKALMAEGHSVVFDDLRFPNEADAIVAAGGKIVRVLRPGCETAEGSHASEGGLNTYPAYATCYNNGTVADLKLNIATLLSYL